MASIEGDSVNARTLSMLQSGKYSDLTISCGNTSLRVHRAIVCPASKFFASACDGDFKEAHTGVINLEDELDIVKRMLMYIYIEDYDDYFAPFEDYVVDDPAPETASTQMDAQNALSLEGDQSEARPLPVLSKDSEKLSNAGHSARLTNNVRVYAIADKYGIPGLKDLAKEKFEDIASFKSILAAPSVIYEIYDTTPTEDRGLRDVVTNLCARWVRRIVDYNKWRAAVQVHVEFTFDLLRAYVDIVDPPQENVENTSGEKRKRSDRNSTEVKTATRRRG